MIRLAEEKDYLQLANMKWEHCQEDDEVYGEKNLEGVDKNSFMKEFIGFLKADKSYHIFVYEKNEEVTSAMFVNVISKVKILLCQLLEKVTRKARLREHYIKNLVLLKMS